MKGDGFWQQVIMYALSGNTKLQTLQPAGSKNSTTSGQITSNVWLPFYRNTHLFNLLLAGVDMSMWYPVICHIIPTCILPGAIIYKYIIVADFTKLSVGVCNYILRVELCKVYSILKHIKHNTTSLWKCPPFSKYLKDQTPIPQYLYLAETWMSIKVSSSKAIGYLTP